MEHESRNTEILVKTKTYMFVKESRLGQFYARLTVSLGVVNLSWCSIEIRGDNAVAILVNTCYISLLDKSRKSYEI